MNTTGIVVDHIVPARRHVKRHRWMASRRIGQRTWDVAYGRTRRRAISNLVHHRQR